MGLEALCHGTYGQEAGEGKLDLEGGLVRFRGAFRLDIPTAELAAVKTQSGELTLQWGKQKHQRATFALGEAAASKWADKILHPPSLLDKLGIKPNLKVALSGTFEAAFVKELESRVKPAMRLGAGLDVVLLAATKPADLERVAGIAAKNLAPAGALWIVYAKGKGHAIGEAHVRRAALEAGLVDTKVCAFSATHPATKWVRPRATRSA